MFRPETALTPPATLDTVPLSHIQSIMAGFGYSPSEHSETVFTNKSDDRVDISRFHDLFGLIHSMSSKSWLNGYESGREMTLRLTGYE